MRTSQTVTYSTVINADEFFDGAAQIYVAAWGDGEVILTVSRFDDVGEALDEVIVILTPEQARDVQHALLSAVNTTMRHAGQRGDS